MSVPMLKNFTGVSVTDEELRNIPNPKLELIVHVTYKTVEAFTCLSSFVVAPSFLIYRHFKGKLRSSIGKEMMAFGAKGSLLGIFAGPILTYLVTWKDPETKDFDRCFRLRHNRNQLNIDRSVTVTALVGSVGFKMVRLPLLYGFGAGVMLGVPCGVLVNKLL